MHLKAALPPQILYSLDPLSCGMGRRQTVVWTPLTGVMMPAKATPGTDGAWEGYSMYIPGAITDKRRASQTITINKSSDSTYILSGWAQAYSAPQLYSGDRYEGR